MSQAKCSLENRFCKRMSSRPLQARQFLSSARCWYWVSGHGFPRNQIHKGSDKSGRTYTCVRIPTKSSCPAYAFRVLERDAFAQALCAVAISAGLRYRHDRRKHAAAPTRRVLTHPAFEHQAAGTTLFLRGSSGVHCAVRNTLHKVTAPNRINKAAANRRTALVGMRSANFWPTQTAGTLASIIPSVVPMTTVVSASKRAASATVASCVLSPISARKNATNAVTKAPDSCSLRESPSASGCKAHK